MDVFIAAKVGADLVEQRGRGNHLRVAALAERVLLDGRGVDADADRLGENESIARFRAGIAPDLLRRAGADNGKPIDRLRAVDRVPACNRDAGARAGGGATLQNFTNDLRCNLTKRDAED